MYFDQQRSACHMQGTMEAVHWDEMPVTSQAAGRQRRCPRQLFFLLHGQIQLQCDTQTEDSAALFEPSAVRKKREPKHTHAKIKEEKTCSRVVGFHVKI